MIKLRFIDFGWPFVSQTIQWWTSSWVTHVDIIVGSQMISAYPNGVEWRSLDEFPAIKEEVFSVACSQDQRRSMVGFLNEQIGKPYDYLGPLLYPLRINHNRTWFCSALVAAALNEAGVFDFKHPHLTSPADIHRAVLGAETCAIVTS